jgi:carbonic anhydrase/acetyltransferase-like protein (isoleucine patch superfamily)
VKLEKGVTVGHRAVIHGAIVQSYTLIGMSATLLDGSKVGTNCLIGAGALVGQHSSIPDGQLAFGIPAKAVRPLKAEETKMIVDRAAHYIEYAATYRKALQKASQ